MNTKRLNGILTDLYELSDTAQPPYMNIRKKLQQKIKINENNFRYDWEAYFRHKVNQQINDDVTKFKFIVKQEQRKDNGNF